jgi:xylulokinase
MSYLGLDIGTGGCKAVVFNEKGRELASAYREYPLIQPQPGWAELDSERVMSECFEVIREVNARVQTDPVVAMSVTSQGEAFTAVDAQGRALCHAMVSSDSRAKELTKSWSEEFGAEKIYQITGHTPYPMFSLYKLLWLKNNRQEVWNQTRWFLCFEDLFQFHTGIRPKISWSLAGRTMLFNVTHHVWSDEILSSLALDSSRLAEPIPSGTVAGVISLEKARELGFVNEVVVVAGGHDQTCGALGAGVTQPGMCMYATGTVECFCPVLERPSFSEDLRRNNLCCYDYTVGGRYTTVAYSLTGGNILRWMRDTLGQTEAVERRTTDGYS